MIVGLFKILIIVRNISLNLDKFIATKSNKHTPFSQRLYFVLNIETANENIKGKNKFQGRNSLNILK